MLFYFSAVPAVMAQPASITIDLTRPVSAISPYIYGVNEPFDSDPAVNPNATVVRTGGNRLTGYNWENNFSHAGNDWQHFNDANLVFDLPRTEWEIPGRYFTWRTESANAVGARSLLTMQMAGWVAGDDNRAVGESETAPSHRWTRVETRKSGPFSLTPATSDGVVYLDEAVNFLLHQFGPAEAGGVWGYSLDNEPALWASTHPRLHPEPVGVGELIERSVALASMVKDLDPSALIFGPALYGWAAFASLQNAPDWNAYTEDYDWFIDAYLAEMRSASRNEGRRLLDVLDVHWYPEAQGDGRRIVFSGDNDVVTPGGVEARLQAPRSLWDPEYTEESWISQWATGGPIRLIPRLQASIAAHFPGTRLAITEYDYGANFHVSGGLALADALGVFGRENVFAANFWGNLDDYVTSAFRLYRNYDGALGTFGDRSLSLEVSDDAEFSAYASLNTAEGGVPHLIVINKLEGPREVAISFQGGNLLLASARVFGFGPDGPEIIEYAATGHIVGNMFTYTVPGHTALHFVFEPAMEAGQPAIGHDGESAAQIAFRTRSDLSYTIERSTDLQTWTPDGSPVTGSGEMHQADVPAPEAGTAVFYRVVVD